MTDPLTPRKSALDPWSMFEEFASVIGHAADPADPSNQPADATTGWCATYDGSGGPNCPATSTRDSS